LIFLKKIKNTDSLMGAKFKSKAHLLSTFFDFWRRFFARLASRFEKSTNMAKKGIKNAEFHADFKSVEKVF
jgi:hypothetical protein